MERVCERCRTGSMTTPCTTTWAIRTITHPIRVPFSADPRSFLTRADAALDDLPPKLVSRNASLIQKEREKEEEEEEEEEQLVQVLHRCVHWLHADCGLASSELCFFLLQFQRARARLHQAYLNGLTFRETRHSHSTRTTISWPTQSQLVWNP